MIAFVFGTILLCYLFISGYFAWRYVLRRRVQSALCAVMPLGWVLVVARELHWSPPWITKVLLAAALTIGVTSVGIILINESQKHRPFQ